MGGRGARINAPPKSNQEWDKIEQEIRSVQRLVPGNWYGEYLQNRVAEARKAASRSGRLVVRGSAPDENPPRKFPKLLGRSRPSAPPSQPAAVAAGDEQALGLPAGTDVKEAPRSAPTEPQSAAPGLALAAADETPGTSTLGWHVYESANFRVYHVDAAVASRRLRWPRPFDRNRPSGGDRWRRVAPGRRSARFYLYPTPRDFAQMTGQPETSPGFSTMGINGKQIITRRVNLRANHPQLLTAILPHEVTHVVLADLFTEKQIPRWADEGMAVLAEPVSEQATRASDLAAPLEQNRLFRLSELMAIDYPNAESWSLYYAQSVSLTQFLVELASPEQFVAFVKSAQRQGIEQALRNVYHIEGFADLENRWQNYARRQVATIAASKGSSAGATDESRKE